METWEVVSVNDQDIGQSESKRTLMFWTKQKEGSDVSLPDSGRFSEDLLTFRAMGPAKVLMN